MKRVKRLFGDLIAAAISLLILASAFALPFETVKAAPTAAGPAPYSEPCKGAGRIALCMNEEKTYDSVASDSGESEADKIPLEMGPEPISPGDAGTQNFTNEDVKETETEFVEDIYVPDTEAETYEEYVEVIPEMEDPPETDLDALIVQVAGEYGLPWELVRAVVWAESTFDPYAVSDHPDYGLMQVWEQVWIDHGYDPKDPIVYDPETNLRMGCQVLKQKIDAHDGDFANALTCYRFGDGGALEKWRQGEYSNWYNERVLGKYYEILREG